MYARGIWSWSSSSANYAYNDLRRQMGLWERPVDRVGVDGEATIMICLPVSLVDIASFSLPPG